MLRRSAAVLVLCLGLFGLAAEASPVRDSSITGWFEVVWADPRRGTEGPPEAVFVITDYGESVRLDVEEATLQSAGGILKLNHQRVTIDGAFSGTPSTRRTYRAERIRRTRALNPNPAADAVTGAQPWVPIACKFSDVVTEPNNLTYFQNMYANASPGLDHYWRQQSYDLVNVAGSLAAGWFTLPQPRSYYVYDQNSDGEPDADLNRLVTDCVNVADPTVNFANFVGINMMFNDLLDCCAWGGGWYMNKDGVEKSWRVTWDPPWAYQDIAVIGHEMGHGFGLPHSSGQYGYTYDNQWDVMSDTWSNCSNLDDPTYGCLGQHTISHHKNYLEWIAVGQRYTHPSGTSATITLEQLALPATGNYRMAVIPINGSSSHFYTVEVRRKVGYDVKLPGEGVIIHEVLTSRSRPANVVDPDGNFNTGDAGAIWTAGETFTDGANGVQVTVNSATATGYSVTINTGVVTTVDLTSSANPSSAGQEVTFTATVNGGTPGSATGTVTFKSDGDELATIALVNAQATYSTSSLPLGGHFITAHYSGSLTHPAAVSPSLFQKVYPLVSINDVAVNEGNAGTTNATFNVTLSQASELPVSVDFSTSNVTAVGGQTFVNSNQVAIPLGGTATPYPSTINVSGVSGNITKLTVQLSGYRHTWPGDVDVLLVGPGGQSLVLLSDAGLNNDVYLVNLTFDDSAATSLTSAPVTSGIYKPSNFDDAEG
ncbi:MAG: Ig-like domain repeat protein, partial [Thermoanaerobaculia bacterium]